MRIKKNIPGGYDWVELEMLQFYLDRIEIEGCVLEIGSARGRSFINLGLNTDRELISIDPHVRGTFEEFEVNANKYLKEKNWKAVRAKSSEVTFDRPIAFLHIDGSHEFKDVRNDFRKFGPLVPEGGYVAFHDYKADRVRAVVSEAANDGWIPRTLNVTTQYGIAILERGKAGLKPQTQRNVVICGFSPRSFDELDKYLGLEFELWGLSYSNMRFPQYVPHFCKFFDMHHWEKALQIDPIHLDFLQTLTCPVYMIRHYPEIPNSIPYPRDEILKQPWAWERFFTNTISWMLALCAYERVNQVHLLGIDMTHKAEHLTQKPAVEYFIGLLRGMGITVMIPAVSELLKTGFLYGYENPDPTKAVIEKEIAVRQKLLKEYSEQRAKLIFLLGQTTGALDAANKYEICHKPQILRWQQEKRQCEMQIKTLDEKAFIERGKLDGIMRFNYLLKGE